MKTTTISLNDNLAMLKHIDVVWDILNEGYANVKGGLFFRSKMELLESTSLWKVILFKGVAVAVTIYKAKRGLKLVAMSVGRKFRDIAVTALGKLIRRDLKRCWMELSEAAEKFVLKNGGVDYVVPNHMVEKILEKEVVLSADGIHYEREVMAMRKEKILLGTIKLAEK